MGHLEQKVTRTSYNTHLQRAILRAASSIGETTAAMLAGSLYRAYKLIDKAEQKRKYKSILKARERLIERGLLKKNGKFVELTPLGRKLLQDWEHRDYKIPQPKKWDGKWRVLIFDISENKRELREKVRNTLRAIGFKWLQDSVWVYPYDCEDFITLLKADFKIGKDLLYIIAEAIENDRGLRDYFQVYT